MLLHIYDQVASVNARNFNKLCDFKINKFINSFINLSKRQSVLKNILLCGKIFWLRDYRVLKQNLNSGIP